LIDEDVEDPQTPPGSLRPNPTLALCVVILENLELEVVTMLLIGHG